MAALGGLNHWSVSGLSVGALYNTLWILQIMQKVAGAIGSRHLFCSFLKS